MSKNRKQHKQEFNFDDLIHKAGAVFFHKRYFRVRLQQVMLPEFDENTGESLFNGGVLLSLESHSGKKLLNEDRLLIPYANAMEKDCLHRFFEPNLSYLATFKPFNKQ